MSMLVNKKDVVTSRFIEIEDALDNFMQTHNENEKVIEVGKDHLITIDDPVVFVKELGLIMAHMTYLNKVDEHGYHPDWDGTAVFKLENEQFKLVYYEQDSMLITAANYTCCGFDKIMSANAIIFAGINFATVLEHEVVSTIPEIGYEATA